MSTFIIPLTNFSQQFQIDLAGVQYSLTCKWNNSPDAGWVLDFEDTNGNPIVANVPLVTGTDLLAQLQYLGFNGQLIVFNGTDNTAVPTYANLGTGCNLYFITSVNSG